LRASGTLFARDAYLSNRRCYGSGAWGIMHEFYGALNHIASGMRGQER